MNPKICKKCRIPHDFYDVWAIEKEDWLTLMTEDFERSDGLFCKLITTDKETIAKYTDHVLSFTDELIPFSDLEYESIHPIKEVCPYYLEHEISDWNKKDESGSM